MNRSVALGVLAEVRSLCGVLDCLSVYNTDVATGTQADAWAYVSDQVHNIMIPFRDALVVLGLNKNDRLVSVCKELDAFAFAGAPLCFRDARRVLDAAWVFYSFDLDRNTVMEERKEHEPF